MITRATQKPAPVSPELPRHCCFCISRSLGACGALTAEQLGRLAASAHRRRYTAGQRIVSRAAPDDHCISLVSGSAKLLRELGDGRQQIVGLAAAPSLLTPLLGADADTTAVALTEADACVVSRTAFEAIRSESREFERRLHLSCAKDLKNARDQLATLGRKSARERVAGFLVMAFERLCVSEDPYAAGAFLDLPLSRGEIADFVGLTIETVSRQFTSLKNEGAIAVPDGRRVVMVDFRILEAAARC